MAEAERLWCGKGQYDGLEEFYFGTIALPARAKDHEVRDALVVLWHRMHPHAPPPFVPVPGMLVFVEEK
jgi:hypothetical protein